MRQPPTDPPCGPTQPDLGSASCTVPVRALAKHEVRSRLLPYTRRAYGMLPSLDRPRILDVGCGSGVPTLELVRLSGGRVVALDIDLASLAELRERAKTGGIASAVLPVQGSLRDTDFPAGTFDIVWCEGAVAVLGFSRTLRCWRRWLRDAGFLVLHDERADIEGKLRQIHVAGYRLLGTFEAPVEVWRREYFEPLAGRIRALRTTYAGDPEALAELDKEHREIDAFTRDPESCASQFFVMGTR